LPADPAPRHHRSLRAALDWSYDLLTPPEQRLLQRLSVFVGGCSLAGVETVGGDEGAGQAHLIDLVSSLVVKSLVIADTLHRREARYSLLETIRRYAREKLAADGSEPEVRNRHLDWFLRLAEETAPKLGGPYQHLWLSWLDEEVENLRAALAWSLETGSIERGLRMAVAVYQYWTIRDLAEEGLGWIERLLARADDRVPRALRANALAYGAFLAGFRGQAAAQIRYGAEAAALVEAAGMEGKPALRWALAAQADAARASGDYQTEFSLGERVIRLNRELADRQQLGLTLSIYSFSAMAIGRYDAARAMLDEALPLLREAGNPYRIAMALNFSGDLARCERSWAQAEGVYRESIALLRELGAVRDLASALHNLGHARLHLGDVEGALGLFRESLALHLGQQNRPGMAECLIGFAAVAIAQGQPSAGARLLAAVVAVGGPAAASAWAATRLEYDGCLALARAALPPDELQAELAAGSRFSQEQAVDLAQGLALTTPAMLHSRVRADPLTRREREVAGWIAQGKTNGEIAEGLVLSKRTVEKHIANILSKLGLTNRAQIVRWAIESGAASDRAIPQAER
jgi:non-specific serine/threonine protein kinase